MPAKWVEVLGDDPPLPTLARVLGRSEAELTGWTAGQAWRQAWTDLSEGRAVTLRLVAWVDRMGEGSLHEAKGLGGLGPEQVAACGEALDAGDLERFVAIVGHPPFARRLGTALLEMFGPA